MPRRTGLPPGVTPRCLGALAAAEYLGISLPQFERYVGIKPVEIGHRKVWDIKSLDRWLDAKSGFGDALRPLDDYLGALGNDHEIEGH